MVIVVLMVVLGFEAVAAEVVEILQVGLVVAVVMVEVMVIVVVVEVAMILSEVVVVVEVV